MSQDRHGYPGALREVRRGAVAIDDRRVKIKMGGPLPTRPFLSIVVAWHPAFTDGHEIARAVFDHFRRDLYKNAGGGTGLPVYYRYETAPNSSVPVDIDFATTETLAVVILMDDNWLGAPDWVAWGEAIMDRADIEGTRAQVFPVAVSAAATELGMPQQAIRWYSWSALELKEHQRSLTADLAYQFSRMLRSYLARLQHSGTPDEELGQYLKKVEIFLSHSKHDDDGERIAKIVRRRLFEGDGLASFFDVHDIPSGQKFDKVILHKLRNSAVVAIHTDSYSAREWCRREVIEAKFFNVPLVVVNCISNLDERAFPYLGNVPVVRMDPSPANRVDEVISRLLDEVLKDFLWKCWVELVQTRARHDVVFVPRPPELITLAAVPGWQAAGATIVYPEPPLGAEEIGLFWAVAPSVRLQSTSEWLAASGA